MCCPSCTLILDSCWCFTGVPSPSAHEVLCEELPRYSSVCCALEGLPRHKVAVTATSAPGPRGRDRPPPSRPWCNTCLTLENFLSALKMASGSSRHLSHTLSGEEIRKACKHAKSPVSVRLPPCLADGLSPLSLAESSLGEEHRRHPLVQSFDLLSGEVLPPWFTRILEMWLFTQI